MASKKSKAARRKAAYGAPAEEREVVVTVDKRLLFGASLLIVFGLAVGISALAAARGNEQAPVTSASNAAGAAAAAQQGANPVRQQLESRTQAEIESDMRAAGLNPENAQVVQPEQYNIPEVVERDPAGDDASAPMQDSPQQVLKEMKDEGSVPSVPVDDISERVRSVAEKWTGDVLAGIPDPNVTADEFKAFRPEDLSEPLKGPRLGIAGLNTVYTYDYGLIAMDEPARRDLVMENVGDEPLIISRIYSGCGCTAPRIGDIQIDSAGWLPEPLTLQPGEQVDFTVEFDPQLSNETGPQAKWIQIFSNDDSKEMFDPADPYSHETRFRIVVEPTYGPVGDTADEDDGGQ